MKGTKKWKKYLAGATALLLLAGTTSLCPATAQAAEGQENIMIRGSVSGGDAASFSSDRYEEIQDALKDDSITTIDYILREGSSVAEDAQKEVFTAIQDDNKTMSFVFQEEDGTEAYRWTFQGSEIIDASVKVDFQILVDANDEHVLAIAPKDVQEVDLAFYNEGVLPGRANISVNVSEFFSADKLYLYYYNPQANALELVSDNVAFDGKNASFYLDHCSNYILTANMLKELLPVNPTPAPQKPTPAPQKPNSTSTQQDSVQDTEMAVQTIQTVPIANGGNAIEYCVVKGDTLSRIARKQGITLKKLLSMNPQIKNPNFIRIGQIIIIGYEDGLSGVQLEAVPGESYDTVQKGDSLYKIAQRNQISLEALCQMNPELAKQKYIYIGQKVRIK